MWKFTTPTNMTCLPKSIKQRHFIEAAFYCLPTASQQACSKDANMP